MKKSVIYMMILGASFSVLASCDNVEGKKEDSMAKRIELKRYNDSLKLDSFKRVEAAKVALEEERKLNEQKASAARPVNRSSATRSQSVASQPVSQNTTTSQQQKKGWSDAAKGGVIGGAAGAGIGALIDKKKPGRGAVIGAAVGGGSGYAIGRKSDRESGRVQK